MTYTGRMSTIGSIGRLIRSLGQNLLSFTISVEQGIFLGGGRGRPCHVFEEYCAERSSYFIFFFLSFLFYPEWPNESAKVVVAARQVGIVNKIKPNGDTPRKTQRARTPIHR